MSSSVVKPSAGGRSQGETTVATWWDRYGVGPGRNARGMRWHPPVRPIALVSIALLLAGGLAVAPSATSTAPPAVDLVSLVRVDTPTRTDRQRVADLGLDLSEHAGNDFVDVVLHGADDAALLREHGFTWTVRIPDLVAREAEVAASDAAYAAAEDTTPMPSGRKAYRGLADYVWDMKALAGRNPGLVELIRLPNPTLEGRPVYGLEISANVAAEDGKPVFAMMGVHHAREWPSGEHTIEFGFDIVNAFRAGDRRAVDLLHRARVVLVPVVNPDGFHASFEAAKIVDGNELAAVEGGEGDAYTYLAAQAAVFPAYKRKNCRMVDGAESPAGACTAPGARHLGVDPNRNYAGLWGGAGASAVAVDDTYRGPAPFSEPETQNIRHLVSTRQVTMLITNHTFGGLVLRPPGVKEHGVTADEPAMRDLGATMAAANGSRNQAGYQLYDTSGTTEDWSHGATGGFGYTFEIAVDEFHPPFAETVATYFGRGRLAGRGNREAFYFALAAAADPAHHSVIAADAPPGAVLRLSKTFDTRTAPVRAAETQLVDDPGTAGETRVFKDELRTRLLATGHVEWHVNPSTRPAVMERVVYGVADAPSRVFTMDAAPPAEKGRHLDVPFTLTPQDASQRLDVELFWDTPDDLDLEVYRKVDGALLLVDSSGNPAALAEAVSIELPEIGEYVLRVINYDSTATTFHLTAATFPRVVTTVHPRLVPYETWTMTCESPGGRVLQSVDVLVSRGDRVEIDLAGCRSAWPD